MMKITTITGNIKEVYDYFYDGKCSRKEYIDFVNDYKKNSKFISDILLDLLK